MLTLEDCERTVLNAIYKANKRYARWSGGAWVSDAGVESVICHEIAEEFSTHPKWGDWSVELEVGYACILEMSGAAPRPGRPPDLLRGTARADIVVSDAKRRPKYVVEVKRAWNSYAVWDDGRRLCTILERGNLAAGGTLRAGLLAVFNVQPPNARREPEAIAMRQREVGDELKAWELKIRHQVGKWEWMESDEGKWGCQGLCTSLS